MTAPRYQSADQQVTSTTPEIVDLWDEITAAGTEPFPCTGTGHTHRWLRFKPNGVREEAQVLVSETGVVEVSEQAMEVLLREAGYLLADPEAVELAAEKRRSWARSRLQDALNRRAR